MRAWIWLIIGAAALLGLHSVQPGQAHPARGQRLRQPAILPRFATPRGNPAYVYFGSPDGRYVARTSWASEYTHVSLFRRTKPAQRRPVLHAEGTSGCLWVPRHGHWFIFATCAAGGAPASLELWTGGRLRPLLHPVHPYYECLDLYGVSSDGRRIYYRHAFDDDTNTDEDRFYRTQRVMHWMNLP